MDNFSAAQGWDPENPIVGTLYYLGKPIEANSIKWEECGEKPPQREPEKKPRLVRAGVLHAIKENHCEIIGYKVYPNPTNPCQFKKSKRKYIFYVQREILFPSALSSN